MSEENGPDKEAQGRAFTEGLNARQFQVLADIVHPEIEVRSVLAGVDGSVYRGVDGLRSWVTDLNAVWQDFTVEILRFQEVTGDRALCIYRVRGKGTGSGVPLQATIGCVVVWRDGKPWRYSAYADPREALEAAGLSE